MPPDFRWMSWLTERIWGRRFVISSSGLEHGTPQLFEVLQLWHRIRAGGAELTG